MELEQSDERHEQDAQQTQRSASPAATFNPPFVSEGLEQVRDSHC